MTPVNFRALNANCSNTAKDTDFEFDKHVPWDSPDKSPLKFYRKDRCHGHMTPNFLGIKCHATMVKVTDFEFNKRGPWDSLDMTIDPLKVFRPRERACQI